jgi:hypothetical protein
MPNQEEGDAELKAINTIVSALNSLYQDQRNRAIEYVLRRFGVPSQGLVEARTLSPSTATNAPVLASLATRPEIRPQEPGEVKDIRTLKETKNPKSASEMAALVAYYLSEIAPSGDRKDAINKTDIERQFKSAGFRLPADASFTLVNARNAGYLDSAGGGNYKLNPVGYNLVVHRMGSRENDKKAGNLNIKSKAKRSVGPTKKATRVKK